MKIIHLRASNFYGGPERQLHFHCRLAAESEFEITVGSFSENNQQPEFLGVIDRDNISTHTFFVSSAYDRKSVGLVRKYLLDNDVDIICTHDYRSHLIGWIASWETKARWVAFSRGWTRDNLKVQLFHCLDKAILRFANRIVAVSGSQKKKLRRVFISPDRIAVIHNAIEPEAFDDISAVNLRDKFGIGEDSVIAIAGGRFSSEKGQLDLIKAAKIALTRNDKLVFILFGDGPDLNLIKKEITRQGLSSNIICPGFEKNLIGCLKGADFLINPSHSEGLPNIVLEAMAMKIPCVATDVGGVGEMIDDEKSGLLVPPKSSEKLAEAILKIASKEPSDRKIVDNAYQVIINKFSFDIQYAKLTSLYLEVMNS